MTDTPPTDPADDDLLASLYLDGEATADERARVEADPELMARVRSFEATASDLASVTPPADLGRLQISAALDVFDQLHSTASAGAAASSTVDDSASVSEVSSLSERRERKQARGIPNWLSAAAALALVVGGLGFASTLGGGDDESTVASEAMDSGDALASGASRAVEESAATTMTAPDVEAMEESDDAAMDEAFEEEAMEEEAMEDDTEEPTEEAEEAAAGEAANETEVTASPIPLDGLEATTAAEYLEQLSDQPLQPIENSPCAGSPLVEGLFGVDSFIEVVFEGEVSSLLVQEGVPSTAVIVGPTCEIELE